MKPRIVIEIRGGIIQYIISNQEINVRILDHDLKDESDYKSDAIMTNDEINEYINIIQNKFVI